MLRCLSTPAKQGKRADAVSFFLQSNRRAVPVVDQCVKVLIDRSRKRIAEGGIVVSKVMREKKALSQQLMLYREFIRAVFLGT